MSFNQKLLTVLRRKPTVIIAGFIIGCIWTIPSLLDTRTDAGFLAPVIFAYATVGSIIILFSIQSIVFGRWLAKIVGIILFSLVLLWVYSNYQASNQLWCNGQKINSYVGTACEGEDR